MNRNRKTRNSASLVFVALSVALLAIATVLAPMAWAQAPAHFVGGITAISGTTLTIKTDAGQNLSS